MAGQSIDIIEPFEAWARPWRERLAAGEAPEAVFAVAALHAPDASWPGRLWELRLGDAGRRGDGGSWFTPDYLARACAARAAELCRLPRPWRALDPACGAGAFLAALAGDPGIGLHGWDLDERALCLARLRLGGGAADLSRRDTLNQAPLPEWQLIVGNPPYLALPGIPAERRTELRSRFASARGRFNLYMLFLEWCVNALAPGGVGALLVPQRLWLNAAEGHLREWLGRECRVLEVWQLDYPVFADAVVDSSVVFFRREPGTGGEGRVRLVRVASPEALAAAPREEIAYADLDGGYDAIAAKVHRAGRLYGEIAEIRDGIIQSRVGAELFTPAGRRPSDRPLLFGRDIVPGAIRYAGRRIDYRPEAMGALEKSRGGSGLRLRTPAIFETAKMLTRQTADTIVAAWDAEGIYYYANTLHGARITAIDVLPEYLERYLNSPLACYCYRRLAAETGKPFAQVKLAKLRRLPVPVPPVAEQRRIAAGAPWTDLCRAAGLTNVEIKTVEG